MPRPTTIALLSAAAVLVLGAGGTGLFVWSGVYDVAANVPHTQPGHSLLEQTMQQSVRRHARDIRAPPAPPGRLQRGAACYVQLCLHCHGAPGVAQAGHGQGMQPVPGPLIDAARRWRDRELYWITRNGIKMSGMPAWQHRLSETDLWAVVAFLQALPDLSVPDYRALAADAAGQRCEAPQTPASRVGDPARGRLALAQYACRGCHVIPGLSGGDGQVGPPLAGMATRGLIAGKLPNTPDNLVAWIRAPHVVEPDTAMPALGVNEQDARDMAAYLATLR